MKVLVTGAHFTPAVAVIEELKKRPNIEVVYVGRQTTLEGDQTQSIESKILPSLGVKFIPLTTGRLQRAFTIYTIPSLLKIPIGLFQSLYIVLTEKPDVILSFGGYVSVPIVLMGWLASVPIMLHEQTLVSGLANKICSLFADKIAVSFEESELKGEKVILTGNPIRQQITQITNKQKSTKPVVLIAGGNQGSHTINLAIEQCLPKLLKIALVYHQTGDSKFQDFERLSKISKLLACAIKNDNYQLFKFIDKGWEKILAKSDLVVSRAGINTLTELAFLGKPVLLIPLPNITNDEQNKNAKYFKELGLARILSQSKLTGENLLKEIQFMLNHLSNLNEKAKLAKAALIPDASKRLALEVMLYAEEKKI